MMRQVRGLTLLWSLGLAAILSSSLACRAKDESYMGRGDADTGQGEVKQDPVADKAAQRRTVADLRNVGTAMFSWLTDQVGAAAAGQSQTSGESKIISLSQYPPIS